MKLAESVLGFNRKKLAAVLELKVPGVTKVRKRHLSLILSTLFAISSLSADVTTLGQAAFLQQMTIKRSACKSSISQPFGVIAQGFGVGKADMMYGTPGEFSYAEGEVDLLYTQDFTHCEGMSFILGADSVHMDWNDNPFFERTNFSSLDVGFLGYTTRVNRWVWQIGMAAQLSLNYDPVGDYARYTALIWGRYECSKTLGFHAGFYAFYNLKKNKVYPIFGIDWRPLQNWQFNLIFPMSIAANYIFTPEWSLGLAWRPIWSRHRVGPDEPLSSGIWENRNDGAELSLNFLNAIIFGQAFVGYSFGGTLKIMDSGGRNALFFDYKPAPYAGLRLLASF